MMYTTHTIDASRTPLLVGQIYDDAVLARTPSGETLLIPRFDVETPVLSCSKCSKPALLKHDKNTDKDRPECPDHARHMYEALFTGSHDIKRYNRKQRRGMFDQAKRWLGVWRDQVETRLKNNAEHTKKELTAHEAKTRG